MLVLAQTLTRGVSFFYIIYLAKSLGVSDFGLFSVALAYFSIISSITDFGFNRFLVREVAKDKSTASPLLWNIVMLRLTLTAVFFAIFSLILYSLDPDKMRVSLILLATMAILPQSIALTFDGIFVAFQKLQFSSFALFISSLSTVLAGVFLVSRGFGLMGAVNALIFGQLIYALSLIIFLYKSETLLLSSVNLSIIKKAIMGSLPYGLLGVLGLLYFRIDTVMLSYLKGSFETGIYGVSYKFLEAVFFIPSAFSAAFFPILAKLHDLDIGRVKSLYFKSLKVMGFLGGVVLLGYLLVLPEIIKVFLPNYLPSIKAITILSLAIPFMFMQASSVSVLLSTDKYLKSVLFLSVLTLAFNVLGNLIFIPAFGFIGAAWVTTISEILSFVIFFVLTKNKILDKVRQ